MGSTSFPGCPWESTAPVFSTTLTLSYSMERRVQSCRALASPAVPGTLSGTEGGLLWGPHTRALGPDELVTHLPLTLWVIIERNFCFVGHVRYTFHITSKPNYLVQQIFWTYCVRGTAANKRLERGALFLHVRVNSRWL